jgi:hypothetical protein
MCRANEAVHVVDRREKFGELRVSGSSRVDYVPKGGDEALESSTRLGTVLELLYTGLPIRGVHFPVPSHGAACPPSTQVRKPRAALVVGGFGSDGKCSSSSAFDPVRMI